MRYIIIFYFFIVACRKPVEKEIRTYEFERYPNCVIIQDTIGVSHNQILSLCHKIDSLLHYEDSFHIDTLKITAKKVRIDSIYLNNFLVRDKSNILLMGINIKQYGTVYLSFPETHLKIYLKKISLNGNMDIILPDSILFAIEKYTTKPYKDVIPEVIEIPKYQE